MENRGFSRLKRYERVIENQSFKYITAPGFLRQAFAGASVIGAELGRNMTGRLYTGAAHNDRMVHASGLSSADVIRRIALRIRCVSAWQKAREQNDFGLVAEPLQELVDLVRKDAQARAAKLGFSSPYAAMIDGHTPGLKLRDLDVWADDLKKFCGAALCLVKTDLNTDPMLSMTAQDQKRLIQVMFSKMGFDLSMLAETPHSMTLGSGKDVRIGMNYSATNFAQIILDAGHEAGHGLYRGNLPDGSGIAGTAMDESMALMIENHVARTPIFAFNMCALGRELELPSMHPDVTGANLFSYFFRDHRTQIRTQANELAYPLHVILRMEIERMVIDNKMPVAEIPCVWKKLYRDLTDMAPPGDDRSGALQDIHWYADQWGWFPQYLAGMLAAAQLFETATDRNPKISEALHRGRVTPLKEWMVKNIAQRGDNQNFTNIIENVTKAPLDTWAWMNHAMQRYGTSDWWSIRPDYPKPGLTD